MSYDITVLKNTGSRDVDMYVGGYWGGNNKGRCIQLTANEETNTFGCIQLNKEDIEKLIAIASIIYPYIDKNRTLQPEELDEEFLQRFKDVIKLNNVGIK